ncbi:MAG: IS630 family transposase [Microcoleaceae cyanobacterium]
MGWTLKNSAIAVGINYDYAREVLKKYNNLGEEGIENLKNKHLKRRGGKKSLLTDKQLEKLAKELESRPPDGGIWTGPKVARWIEKENCVEKVWNQRGWDYLKKLKYSCQSPRPKHRKGDADLQKKFIKTFPSKVDQLEKQYPEAEIDVWFFDEHKVGLKPILRKVWSPIGERPTAIVSHRYEWLYVYGFVKPKTGETLWYLIPRVNTLWLNLVYKSFAIDAGISEKKSLIGRRQCRMASESKSQHSFWNNSGIFAGLLPRVTTGGKTMDASR